MESQYFYLCIILLAFGTFLIRASFVFFSGQFEVTENLQKVFSYIPAAILPAIITPMVFVHQGSVDFLWGKERFFILLAAIGVCYLTRFNMLLTILFGLGAHYFFTRII